MKVKDVIAELQKLDPESIVCDVYCDYDIDNPETTYSSIEKIWECETHFINDSGNEEWGKVVGIS